MQVHQDSSECAPRRLLLVDDDSFNRDGMRLYFARAGFAVVESGDEDAAWQIARQQPLDVAIIDLAIPPRAGAPADQSCGSRLVWRLKEAFPSLGIVVFSAYEDRGAEFLERINQGVRGVAYKLKGCHPTALLAAVTEVMAGRVVIDGEVRANHHALGEKFLSGLTTEERPYIEYAVERMAELPPRLQEVARLLANSSNLDGIAQALDVSPKTAGNYVGKVYDRLGLTLMGQDAPQLRKAVILVKACMLFDLVRVRP